MHDVNLVVPIFANNALVGFAGIATHLPDIGGRIRSTGVREIFEEGLQIPPLKLFEAGVRNETLVAMIERNVRVPSHSLGDILGAVAGCQALGSKLQELLASERIDLGALARILQSRSEAVMRRAIKDVPDGSYHHIVRHDGFEERIVIDCSIHIDGDEMHIDYAGSSDQIARAVNVVPAYSHDRMNSRPVRKSARTFHHFRHRFWHPDSNRGCRSRCTRESQSARSPG